MSAEQINEEIRGIKHQFMAYRNGIVADTLRSAGTPHKIIFGLQLPQIAEISRNVIHSKELSEALWNDTAVRESRLLACRVYPVEEMDYEKALEMAISVMNREEADILSFFLLRKLHFAPQLLDTLCSKYPASYITEALRRNLE